MSKFAQYYTPIVVFTSLAVALIPPLLIANASHGEWVYRALVLLVISCPCGLVISIPLGYFGGVGRAAKKRNFGKRGNLSRFFVTGENHSF